MKWYKIFDSLEAAESRVALNHTVRISIQNFKICLAHTPQGWFALEDTCPHMGESLSKGKINYLNEITCPWHSYRYNLKSGIECEGRGLNAQSFEIELREDGVYLEV